MEPIITIDFGNMDQIEKIDEIMGYATTIDADHSGDIHGSVVKYAWDI